MDWFCSLLHFSALHVMLFSWQYPYWCGDSPFILVAHRYFSESECALDIFKCTPVWGSMSPNRLHQQQSVCLCWLCVSVCRVCVCAHCTQYSSHIYYSNTLILLRDVAKLVKLGRPMSLIEIVRIYRWQCGNSAVLEMASYLKYLSFFILH